MSTRNTPITGKDEILNMSRRLSISPIFEDASATPQDQTVKVGSEISLFEVLGQGIRKSIHNFKASRDAVIEKVKERIAFSINE